MNGSTFRTNRDTRFSKDKTPHEDHVDRWFWEGDRKSATSGLFLRIAPDAADLAADPTLIPTLVRHWRAFAPLHRWLMTDVPRSAEP